MTGARSPTHTEYRAAGVTLAADRWGDRGDPVVLLLHGGGQTRHAWGATGGVLGARGWCAVAVDLRGHGDSDWHEHADYSADAFRDDVATIIDQTDGRPALVGASLGGQAALLAEGELGPLASALVLVDIAPRVELEGVTRIVRFMRDHEAFDTLDDAVAAVAGYLPARPSPPTAAGLRKNLRRGSDGRWRWHWDPRLLDHQLGPAADDPERLAIQAEGWAARMRDAAAQLSVPTVLVRGRRSDVVSEASVADFLEVVPGAEFVDVSEAGHMVAGDRNDVFTEVVVEFLARHHPAAHSP